MIFLWATPPPPCGRAGGFGYGGGDEPAFDNCARFLGKKRGSGGGTLMEILHQRGTDWKEIELGYCLAKGLRKEEKA